MYDTKSRPNEPAKCFAFNYIENCLKTAKINLYKENEATQLFFCLFCTARSEPNKKECSFSTSVRINCYTNDITKQKLFSCRCTFNPSIKFKLNYYQIFRSIWLQSIYWHLFLSDIFFEAKLGTVYAHNLVCVGLWNPETVNKDYKNLSKQPKKTKEPKKFRGEPLLLNPFTNYKTPQLQVYDLSRNVK